MSDYKLFVQRIGLVGITQILVTLSNVILLPILSKNYSVSDYGIWSLINVTLNLIPSIITLGLPFAMLRFLSSQTDKEEIQEGFYSITVTALIASTVTCILLFFLSGTIAEILFNNNVMVVKILGLTIFFTSLNLIYYNYFRTFQKMKVYSMFMLLQAYLTVVFVYFFAVKGYNIAFAASGILITQIITFSMALVIIVRSIGLKIPEMRNIREYLTLSLPTVSSSISYWIVESSDRYIIGILLGTTFVGYYSPSYTLGNLILMMMYPFSVLLLPLLSKHFDENRMDEVKLYLKYSLKLFISLAVPAAVGLSILSKLIIELLSTPEIATNGYFVTPFVTVSAIMFGIYNIIINIIILNKKTKIVGMIWIFAAILNLILNLIMIPYFGIIGAAIATLSAYTLSFVITVFYSLKYFNFDFDFPFLGKCIISSSLMSLIILYFYPTGILDLLIVIVASAAVYMGILVLLKGFNKEEVNFIKTLLK